MVDIDWFSTEKEFSEGQFYNNSFIGYTEDALTLTDQVIDGDNSLNLLTGSSTSLSVKAVYTDSHTEDVSIRATYTNPHPEIVQIFNGQVVAKTNGDVIVTVSYKGALGDKISVDLHIISSTFPLVSKLFNPSIYSQGTFDESTLTLVTGQYGFGGWKYSAGVNLSGFKYLVAKLGADNLSGISFRIFDENSYWSKAAEYDFGSGRQVVANLSAMYKKGTNIKVNPSHLYIVGFWSSGNSPIVIDKVYLSNSDDYSPVSVNELSDKNSNENEIVDVYTLMGVKIRSQIKRGEAAKGLPNGLYIVGKKKVLITDNY